MVCSFSFAYLSDTCLTDALIQKSPTFLAPETSFEEDSFSMDGGRYGFQDDSSTHYNYCALYVYIITSAPPQTIRGIGPRSEDSCSLIHLISPCRASPESFHVELEAPLSFFLKDQFFFFLEAQLPFLKTSPFKENVLIYLNLVQSLKLKSKRE